VARYDPARLLGLTVQHYPAVGICVVVVEGELDLLTVPLLEQRLREQLAARPTHLILDLEFVLFLGCSGLSYCWTPGSSSRQVGRSCTCPV
jgi:anti-anti-sigma factor